MVVTPQRIGVVGAGMMGSEIALIFALAGCDVRLNDSSAERLQRAIARTTETANKGAARGLWTAQAAEAARECTHPTIDLAEFCDRDFIIEAVFEDETTKADVLRQLDKICNADCLLASNTSSISITALSGHLSPPRRSRFLGTHFFSPVSRMALVEIIPGLDTAGAALETAIAACRLAGKTPVTVKDVVGFAVNRLLHAFLIEAIRLVEEGVATPADIDTACKLGLGHSIGPFSMMDIVSNPLVLQVEEVMASGYGDRFRPRPLLKQLVKAGYDGRRAGRGWFTYPGTQP